MATKSDKFSVSTFVDVQTGGGQQLQVRCHPNDVEKVKNFFSENVKTAHEPITTELSVSHGSYCGYTRYDIEQREYAGGHGGFIELLHIKNPPEDRCGVVIYCWGPYGRTCFTEWNSIEHAREVYPQFLAGQCPQKLVQSKGGVRYVFCGPLTPWFYAVGKETLCGDYVVGNGLADDSVYRLGQRFVVFDDNGIPSVKVCMGCRFIEGQVRDSWGHVSDKTVRHRLVYWDDGTYWNDSSTDQKPRILHDDEMWITEALEQFQRLLGGQSAQFEIPFADGMKFVGRIAPQGKRFKYAKAGDYLLNVTLESEAEVLVGWVYHFEPTTEYPNIVQFVTKRYAQQGKKVTDVKVVKVQNTKGGKKWPGVFYDRSASVGSS